MEFATGAMSSLLPKLEELLLEYNHSEKVKKGIGDLKAELESMQAVMVKVSSVHLYQLDRQVKIWANEARELSYAIEDSLDSFLMRIEGDELTKHKFDDLLKMSHDKCRNLKARHEIDNGIKGIEKQVKNMKEQYDRYKIEDVDDVVGPTIVDPHLSALYNKASDLVGVEEAIDELKEVLDEGVDISKGNLKIVSVVGFGGLGKTALAKALYDQLNKTYHFKAFIPVGQNPDTKKVLRHILLELVGMGLYRATAKMDQRQVMNELEKYRAGRRYALASPYA
jgi:disease resistance protein RPM1